ncbi:hypothetical protein J6590_059981 [Homalodisca vitripennis]|nr:hypothetical protein J6590_059981 [Homalodisca vitripennis]
MGVTGPSIGVKMGLSHRDSRLGFIAEWSSMRNIDTGMSILRLYCDFTLGVLFDFPASHGDGISRLRIPQRIVDNSLQHRCRLYKPISRPRPLESLRALLPAAYQMARPRDVVFGAAKVGTTDDSTADTGDLGPW